MNFIGRKEELAVLEKEYSRAAGFVVIYGRRRIGKTTLIKEFIKNKKAFYFLATEEVESQSMKRFTAVMSRVMEKPNLKNITYNDWVDIFEDVVRYMPNEKKVIVIDEYPYLVKINPAFPSILQNIWDEILKDRNVMLILCGSQISMMKKYALSEGSPLYGRRTAQIRLTPLKFDEIYEEFNMSFEDMTNLYSVIGGIPKYLELFDLNISLNENLKALVFSKNGFLYDEPNFLLKDEVQSPVNYFSIIRAIADGNHKLGSIASALNCESTAVTPYMTALLDLGFVEKHVPVTEKSPEKSRKGLYFISDNFMRFWFKYVYPFKGELELDNMELVFEEMSKDFISNFVAFSYEDICKEIFVVLCKSKKIEFVPSKIGSYWQNDRESDIQLDVMAVDNTNKAIFIGECKYHEKPVGADVYFALRDKVENSRDIQNTFKDYKFIYGVFSKSGFSDRFLQISKDINELVLINENEMVV